MHTGLLSGHRPRIVPCLLLFVFAAFACTTRAPVSQAKDKARVSSRGDGAAMAARPKSDNNAEVERKAVVRPEATTSPAAEESGPIVGYAVAFGRSPAARNLPPAVSGGEAEEVNELNDEIDRPLAMGPGVRIQDGALSRSGLSTKALAALPSTTSFEGLADTDNGTGLVNPSDSNGMAGPNHYVEVVNNRVRVFSKDGTPMTPAFRQSSLFASVGGICAAGDAGDPIVLYDKLADRWQISQFAFIALNVPPYHQCVAESINGDPTGSYYLYDFVLPSNNFPDYPELSTWPDAYYLSTRQFFLGGPFNGHGAIAFERSKMLVGDPTASLIYFSTPPSVSNASSGMLPLDFDGLLLPPPGTPNIFAIYTSAIFGDTAGDALKLFDFHVDFANPGLSTFMQRPESPLAVAAFNPVNPQGRADIEQPPPSLAADNLDSIGDRLMYRLQYRNRDGVESIVAVQTVNALPFLGVFPTPSGYTAAPRYYELRRSTPGAPFAVYDQATFAPDPPDGVNGLNRWMGSVATDNVGNLVIGYSTSSKSVFPSVVFGARAFNQVGGLSEGEATIFAGVGAQQASGNRWGDYSSLSVDPVDECTFYYVNEYYPAGLTQFNWHTRVGKFKFDTCTSPAKGQITGRVTDCLTGLPIVGAVVTASDGHSAATGADGRYTINVPPGSYTVAASDPFRNCDPAAPKGATVANGGTATADFCLTGDSKLNLGPVAIDDSLGNDNGIVNRDECIKLTIGISNDGCIADTNISAVLSTTTPGVTVNQALSAYPNMIVNASGTNVTPYAFTTEPGFVCGTPIIFDLAVTSDKQDPHTLHFTLPTCSGGAPVTVTGNLAPGDATQDGRMGRDGNPSGCAVPKGCPGPIAGSPGTTRLFDEYTFSNNGGAPACMTVALTPNCSEPAAANQIFSEAYLDNYIPSPASQECTNYLGDIGGSPVNGTTGSYSFNVPNGHNFVVVVNAVNSPASTCSSYSATISGFFDDTPANGACPACVLTTTTTTSSLWPPSHNLINVGLAASTTGICPASRDVTVYSDEDDVDPQTIGNMSPDAKNIALSTLRLRAERRDTGAGADGRVYLIVTRTSDGTGNGAFSCKTVTVPSGQLPQQLADVAAQASAAETFCTNNGGAAPAGFFLVGDGPVIGPKQ
jgi:Carboxypeptidase regulatory-like domain